MLDVYRANPKLGNVASPLKQLEENGQLIDSLHQELSKYEAYLSESEVRLQEPNHTPNASPYLGKHTDIDSRSAESQQSTGNNTQNPPPPQSPHAENDFSDDEFADGGTCTALYAYEGSDGSLSMEFGQKFTIIEHDRGDGWTQVRAVDGSLGFIPTSYIQIDD